MWKEEREVSAVVSREKKVKSDERGMMNSCSERRISSDALREGVIGADNDSSSIAASPRDRSAKSSKFLLLAIAQIGDLAALTRLRLGFGGRIEK